MLAWDSNRGQARRVQMAVLGRFPPHAVQHLASPLQRKPAVDYILQELEPAEFRLSAEIQQFTQQTLPR